MVKTFILENLGCANCAAKMEQKITKIKNVEEVSINFLTRKMRIEAPENELDSIMEEAEKVIRKIEKDVVIKPYQ